MQRRKRGRAGGVRRRNKSRKNRPFLPSIIMGNVQSITNKTEELCANARYLSDFRYASVLSFTETWLTGNHSDSHVEIDGFKLLRGDRDLMATGKKSGGGVCVYINNMWCHPNNVFIKHHTCTPNLEMLTVSIRPFYLPREFSHVLLCTIYIPDKSAAKAGSQELSAALHELEVESPDAFIVVNGDFNHGTLKRSGSAFYQHVNCSTRGDTILDLCYSNIKDAYIAHRLPNLGEADHNLVLLLPKYRPVVQRLKPRVINIKQWSADAEDCLRDCFDSTDWSLFIDSSSDIHDLTETISSYIKFCEDLIVPSSTLFSRAHPCPGQAKTGLMSKPQSSPANSTRVPTSYL
ncbi:hypothetical protein HOLleu_31125 [Holothuria leucospilota]|uniref:Endonuclease/exonuclease/phosphatase domain-containing protein n=1 Tax=Holothuria leucospilota TaxID=206669 RepID=A0A9Q1BLR9_HOLLE|nr:hypothetical protein HOLleu_31125 [Holothuria leucospilota]